MASDIADEIIFESLPLWKGVQDAPGIQDYYPFHLGWNTQGWISQTTPQHYLDKVISEYSKKDYNFPTTPPGASSWGNRLADTYWGFIENCYGQFDNKIILEIGAGSLYLANKTMHKYQSKKYIVADPAIKEKPSDSRIEIKREYFNIESFKNDHIDLVISINCLEHLPHPLGFLMGIKELIQFSKGKCVLIFPDEQYLLNGDFNALLHEHISYFTQDSVAKLFSLCGFEVLNFENRENTFYYYFGVSQNPVECETPLQQEFKNAKLNFDKNLAYLKDFISRCLEQKKTLAFHGANNGLNIVLSLLGLANNENILIFDGDEAKTGKYLPACINPIYFSEDSRYKDVDEILVSGVSFYDEIKSFLLSYHGLKPSMIHPFIPMRGLTT